MFDNPTALRPRQILQARRVTLVDKLRVKPYFNSTSTLMSGRNSAVECQLPKLDVAGSTPVARSKLFKGLHVLRMSFFYFGQISGFNEQERFLKIIFPVLSF